MSALPMLVNQAADCLVGIRHVHDRGLNEAIADTWAERGMRLWALVVARIQEDYGLSADESESEAARLIDKMATAIYRLETEIAASRKAA